MSTTAHSELKAPSPLAAALLGGAARVPALVGLLLALAAGGLAFGLASVWVFGDDDGTRQIGEPAEVSTEDLRSLAHSTNHLVYWAGRAPGQRYELTEAKNGAIYIRYLPDVARIGDRRPAFTTVATYPLPDAFEQTARSGEQQGAARRNLPGGGIAVWAKRRPTSVYLAYPGSELLVEVFSPDPGHAGDMVMLGDVGPIR